MVIINLGELIHVWQAGKPLVFCLQLFGETRLLDFVSDEFFIHLIKVKGCQTETDIAFLNDFLDGFGAFCAHSEIFTCLVYLDMDLVEDMFHVFIL